MELPRWNGSQLHCCVDAAGPDGWDGLGPTWSVSVGGVEHLRC